MCRLRCCSAKEKRDIASKKWHKARSISKENLYKQASIEEGQLRSRATGMYHSAQTVAGCKPMGASFKSADRFAKVRDQS